VLRPSAVGTEGERSGDPIIHLHPLDESEHVYTLVGSQGLLTLAKHIGDLLESETQLVGVDELSDQGYVLSEQPIIKPDQEAVKNPGNLFVVGTIHPRNDFKGTTGDALI
jgi:hypothetical protein